MSEEGISPGMEDIEAVLGGDVDVGRKKDIKQQEKLTTEDLCPTCKTPLITIDKGYEWCPTCKKKSKTVICPDCGEPLTPSDDPNTNDHVEWFCKKCNICPICKIPLTYNMDESQFECEKCGRESDDVMYRFYGYWVARAEFKNIS